MKKLWNRCQIEILVFLVFFVSLLLQAPAMEELDSWCTTYYTIGYEYGFSSRLLIGTLTGLIFPQLYTSHLYVLLLAVAVLLSLLAAVVVGAFMKRVDAGQKGMAAFLSVLWIASPASVTYLFQQNTFGRMDTFLLFDTLLIFLVCLFSEKKQKWIVVSALALLAVLTHQAYVFIYFPLPAAVFIYEFFQNKGRGYLPYGLLLFGVCFGMAVYLQVFSQVNCATAEEMYERAAAHTSAQNVNYTVLQFEYFGKFEDHWNAFGQYMIGDCIRTGLVAVALLLPLLVFLADIWKRYLHYSGKGNRAADILMLACHIAYVPIFIITVDWGRWMAALGIFEFLLIFYLFGKRDPAMRQSLADKWERMQANPLPYLLLVAYLAMQGKFDAINASSSAQRVVSYIRLWMGYLQ